MSHELPWQIVTPVVGGGVFTVIEPVAVMLPHPPVKVTVYVPDVVGVPLIVTTLAAQLPVTPAGNPLNVAPVASRC